MGDWVLASTGLSTGLRRGAKARPNLYTHSLFDIPLWRLGLGAVSAFFVGVAKTGMPGIGILSIPLMVIAAGEARQSAGWMLPVLCTGDLFAVMYWRRHAAAGRLFYLAPWVLLGIGAGALALGLSERTLRPMIALIILVMLGLYLRRRYLPEEGMLTHSAPYGVAAGFATTVANAAGPVMNLYLLSKRLAKEEFIATGAWFFFMVNLAKIPIYAYHGLFTRQSLWFDVLITPATIAGALTGRWIVHHIPQRLFEISVIVLTAATAILMLK